MNEKRWVVRDLKNSPERCDMCSNTIEFQRQYVCPLLNILASSFTNVSINLTKHVSSETLEKIVAFVEIVGFR